MCILGLERTFKKFTNFLNPSFVLGIRTSNFPNKPLKKRLNLKFFIPGSFQAYYAPKMQEKSP